MKKSLQLITSGILFILLLFNYCQAQNEANTWYFSYSRGIDFNSGSPVVLTVSGMNEYEGCSAISDPVTGTILIYSDGMRVWNANHTVMPNGYGLQSTYAAGQQALIVPDPGNADQYYLFTSGEVYSGGIDGYRYNIIDMTLNGGLGDVTATKNVLLYAPASEKQCAIKNASGTGYWIATHEFYTNNFVLYELTASGLSAPVVSAAGTAFTSFAPDGCMKFSPDGTRIALTLGGTNFAEVFDFDINTGIVSNPITLGPIASLNPYVYGISFSPNSKRLYVTEENDTNLYQFDLDAGSAPLINTSKTAVGFTSSYALQTMQLAPDGKMYVARNGGAYLAVVNDPDSIGLACNFVDDGFYLSGGFSSYGLPNFPEHLFTSTPPLLQNQFAASDSFVCEKFCVDFFDASTNNPTAWLWEFPGGIPSSSSDQNPANICYDNPGMYDVTLITTNSSGTDTLTLPDFITVYATPPFPVITQSEDTLTSSTYSSYQWQFNSVDIAGATNQSYIADQTGYYTVVVSDSNGCNNSATIYVEITGMEDLFSLQDISIYPNPSNGGFTVELLNCQMADHSLIEVTNSIGQIVFTSEESKSASTSPWKKEINLVNPASGVYFLELSLMTFSEKNKSYFLKKKIIVAR